MNFRRSDFDVTNRINTTDPVCVKLEVVRIFRTLYSRNQAPMLARAFDDVVRLYRGEFPGYTACDTEYHDLQHILDVTLAMARMLDGYERSRGDARAIGERLFQLGVICALKGKYRSGLFGLFLVGAGVRGKRRRVWRC